MEAGAIFTNKYSFIDLKYSVIRNNICYEYDHIGLFGHTDHWLIYSHWQYNNDNYDNNE